MVSCKFQMIGEKRLINKITIESGKLEPDPNYWSLAFTGHTNIEKCYGEKKKKRLGKKLKLKIKR